MFPIVQEVRNKILSSFSQLKYVDDSHQYFLGNKELGSVSNTIKCFYKSFDAVSQSQLSATYDKSGKTAEQLQAEWKKAGDDACALGHKVHKFGEDRFYDPTVVPSDGFEVGIIKFWNSLQKWIIPVLCETQVHRTDGSYAGTFDLLLYDLKNQGLIIADYKTNKNLFKNYKGKKMLPPFEFLLDTPYNHYQLQQSLYQIPLEEIGLKVIDRWLIHLIPKPNNPLDGDFKKYELHDYTKQLMQAT